MKASRSSPKTDQSDLVLLKQQIKALEQEQAKLKKVLKASQKKSRQYFNLIEKAHDIIYETNANGHFIFINPVTEMITGYSKENLIGKHYLELVSPDFQVEAGRFYEKQFVNKILNTYFELPLISKNGGRIWVGQHVQLLMRGDKVNGFQAMARDITKQKQVEEVVKDYQEQLETMVESRTLDLKNKNQILEQEISERKQAEAALKESEKKYRTFLETIEVGYYEVDLAGNLTFCNDAMARIIGYSMDEMQGMNNRQYTDPENAKILYREFNRTYRTGNPSKSIHYEVTTKNGEKRGIETSISLIRDSSRRPVGFRGISRDITELKRAQEALDAAHAKTSLLINSISSILIAVSEDNRILFWNTEAEKQFGLLEKEVLGKPLNDLKIQWDGNHIVKGIFICRKENSSVWLDNVKFIQVDGKEGILGIKIDPVFGDKSLEIGTLIQGSNVTKRRIMENQLMQAQKLEAIGQLAAGIAHEINTPIQYVGDNVQFLRTSFEDLNKALIKYEVLKEGMKEGRDYSNPLVELEKTIQEIDLDFLTQEIPKALHQTLDGIERVSRIVQSIKAFAHPGTEEKIAVDINQVIENTILMARNEWKYIAELVTELDPYLPLVYCVPGDVSQAILNVLINAAQAISEKVDGNPAGKGRITIATRRDDSWVEIRISDTGNGIPVEIQSKIFDPFFTTKEVGKGTGQGLAISHTAVVERHHGSITFDTRIGQGTTFNIRLPIQ